MINCKDIEELIKQGKKDEIFLHLEKCELCYRKYLGEESYRLLGLLSEVEKNDIYWAKQRNIIISKIKEKEERLLFGWFRYAAIIILAIIITLLVEIPRERIKYREDEIVVKQKIIKEIEKPIIEELKNPNARLYKIELDQDTHLIMIVDPNIDL